MLYDPERHEPLRPGAWDEARARVMIEQIVRDTEDCFSPETHWPLHLRDADGGKAQPVYPLYFGACGVVWALHYLEALGAIRLNRSYENHVESLSAPKPGMARLVRKHGFRFVHDGRHRHPVIELLVEANRTNCIAA